MTTSETTSETLPSTTLPSTEDLIRVFVYGTLQPGECNYQRYCAGRILRQQRAIAQGLLFDLPMGYPAMTPGTGRVSGSVLEFRDAALLELLDELEDYDPLRPVHENEYERVRQPIFTLHHQPLGTAWVYRMTVEQARRWDGEAIASGEWSGARSRFPYRPELDKTSPPG